MMSTEKNDEVREQLVLPLELVKSGNWKSSDEYRACLLSLLQGDLDFHNRNTSYATHGVHAFPAKFPPQLPRLFIEALTHPGEIVLDPMAGSGTTLLEAYLSGRQAWGCDIDPLALRISAAKVSAVDARQLLDWLGFILKEVQQRLQIENEADFHQAFERYFDEDTMQFIEYWFAPSVARQLFYLIQAIQKIPDESIKLFFEVAFSSIIITKNGGVSLALDLAHTRPHRAKVVFDEFGTQVLNVSSDTISSKRKALLTKKLRPVLSEFEKRVRANLECLPIHFQDEPLPRVIAANAQALPIANEVVDLIVTSPPYASNAIDYMRAHKFSLIWMGYSIGDLGKHRHEYIGDEAWNDESWDLLPPDVERVLERLTEKSPKKVRGVRRYYTEMKKVLSEMYRVLRPGRAAIVVVGTSVIGGIDIEIETCLAAIGRETGFEIPGIGVRTLDRNKRMLPASNTPDFSSQIQQRMHQEFVIGFYKPEREGNIW